MEVILLIVVGLCFIIIPLKLASNSEAKTRQRIKENTGAEKILRIPLPNYHTLTVMGFENTIRFSNDEFTSKDMNVDEIVVKVMSKEEVNQKFSLGKAAVGTVVFGATGGAVMGNKGKTTTENYEVVLLTVKDKYNNDRSIEISMTNYERLMSFLMEYKN